MFLHEEKKLEISKDAEPTTDATLAISKKTPIPTQGKDNGRQRTQGNADQERSQRALRHLPERCPFYHEEPRGQTVLENAAARSVQLQRVWNRPGFDGPGEP